MADLVIRGMEMPKYFTKAEFGIDADGNSLCMVYHEDGIEPDIYDVVPLPEGHGDFVERKALNLFPDYKEVRNRIKQTIKATERDKRTTTGVTIDLLKQTLVALDSLRSVRRYFLDAKTIVPAEGVGEDG
jgi:hypothetical protein